MHNYSAEGLGLWLSFRQSENTSSASAFVSSTMSCGAFPLPIHNAPQCGHSIKKLLGYKGAAAPRSLSHSPALHQPSPDFWQLRHIRDSRNRLPKLTIPGIANATKGTGAKEGL
jgi:hypothetical protein